MPATSIFSANDLADLRCVCDDLSQLIAAHGLCIPAPTIAEAVMNCAAYCSDINEIKFRAFSRLSEANVLHKSQRLRRHVPNWALDT